MPAAAAPEAVELPAPLVATRMRLAVLENLQLITAGFGVLMVVFALFDPWVIGRPAGWTVAGLSLFIAVSLGLVAWWLHRAPPADIWAYPIAILVGVLGMMRALSYLIASPDPDRVHNLMILLIGAGCVLLSPFWLIGYCATMATIWYSIGMSLAPEANWAPTAMSTTSAMLVSYVVLLVRRRSRLTMLRADLLHERAQADLDERVLLSEAIGRISTRLLAAEHGEFEAALTQSLQELGELLDADHAFLCRVDYDRLCTSVTHEWAAPGVKPRAGEIQNASLKGQTAFLESLFAGEPTHIPDALAILPEVGGKEIEELRKLRTRAFLCVPLPQREGPPYGYFGVVHDSQPRYWSTVQISMVKVVGDVLMTSLGRLRTDFDLRNSEHRFRRLFDANIIGVFFADLAGTIFDANDRYLRIVGYKRSDLPLRWDKLTPPEWRKSDIEAVERLFREAIDQPWEKEFFHRDGHRVPVLIGGAMLDIDDGECVAFVLDLTEQKADQRHIRDLHLELERAARLGMMGEMIAGFAHEVHQPLTAIQNFAAGARRRLEQERLTTETFGPLIKDIERQCERAHAITQNIRNFVQKRRPEPRRVCVNANIRECLHLAAFDIQQAQVSVVADLYEPLPEVLIDPTELSQILLNLILNAVQAMSEVPTESRTLKVTTRTDLANDGMEVIWAEICDTGPGIPEEAHSRLFEQFFTTKIHGLGMGLSIARSLAEATGGRLELAGASSTGSCFRVILPAAPSQS